MQGISILKNDKGAVLVVAMLVLLLLTVMGRGVTTTSHVELGIAGNQTFYKKTFYSAEAGIEHLKAVLQNEFAKRNQPKIASGQSPDWDFALDGTVKDIQAAADTNFAGGAVWIKDCAINKDTPLPCHYTVTVWNNPSDKGGITDDTDQLLCIRSVAAGPRGTTSAVEVILVGQVSGEPVEGYFSQAGAGSGRNHNIREFRSISDFTVQ